MKQPVRLDETIEVARPPAQVFAYISDFARIEEWDPAVARGVRLGNGAPGLGSEYRIEMKAGFALHYRVTEFEPGRRMKMAVSSRFFDAEEEILFTPTATGTAVRYIAEFSFPATLAALSRAFPGVMDRVGKSAVAGMRAALEDANPVPAPSRVLGLTDRLVLPGLWRFTRPGYRAARRRFRPLSASLAGRHVLITGATSGIGRAAAEELVALGAELTLVARDPVKAAETAAALRARAPGAAAVHIEIADLESMAGVHALAERLLAAGRPIDVLVNNAGALFDRRELTAEGYERSFALLLLGPWILTERLLPLLRAAPAARVVNVLSGGMYTQRIRVDDLQYERGRFSGAAAYARAKRGLMIATRHWAERWKEHGISVNAMHPGWADTPGVASALPAFRRITRPVLRSAEEGADTIVWLAGATEAGRVSGDFWLDRVQHPEHIFASTRETAVERAQLVRELEAAERATRQRAARRRKVA